MSELPPTEENITQEETSVKEFKCDTTNFLKDIRPSPRKKYNVPKPARALTKRKKARLIEEISKTGILAHALRVADINASTYYRHLDLDLGFNEEVQRAMDFAVDSMEAEAIRRGVLGYDRESWVQGKKVTTKEYSDPLLMMLLKGRKSEIYGAKAAIEISGKDGGPIQIAETKSKLLGLLNFADEDFEDITDQED